MSAFGHKGADLPLPGVRHGLTRSSGKPRQHRPHGRITDRPDRLVRAFPPLQASRPAHDSAIDARTCSRDSQRPRRL